MDYLIFSVMEDRYAIPVSQVREIVDRKTALHADSFHPSFIGFVDHREGKVPVYSLRKRLDYADEEDGDAIVIVDTGSTDRYRFMALLVDEVLEVVSVDLRRLSDLPGFEKSGARSPCRRIIDGEDALIIVLDATSLVEEEERKALAAI